MLSTKKHKSQKDHKQSLLQSFTTKRKKKDRNYFGSQQPKTGLFHIFTSIEIYLEMTFLNLC